MKFKMFYTFFVLVMGSYVFYSASGGPGAIQGADRTGGPVANAANTGFCGNNGCHATGAFNAGLTITVKDGTNEITSYQPGATYTVEVNITDDGNATAYGFQAIALDDGNAEAGAIANFPAGLHTVEVGGRNYVEQDFTSDSGSFSYTWTAPAAGSGDVTVYAAGIAGNGNGSSSGDGAALGNVMLTEMVSGVFQVEKLAVALDIYPNPVQNNLNLSIESDIRGTFDLNIFDLKGQLLQKEVISLSATSQHQQISVTNLPKGNYMLQLTDGKKMISKKMIKM